MQCGHATKDSTEPRLTRETVTEAFEETSEAVEWLLEFKAKLAALLTDLSKPAVRNLDVLPPFLDRRVKTPETTV